jgi:hypothetical protein
MTPEELIARGLDAQKKLCADSKYHEVWDWLVYADALLYGKSITKGPGPYGAWIKENGLDKVTYTDRSYAVMLRKNWHDIEKYRGEDQPLHGLTNAYQICYLYQKIKKGKFVAEKVPVMPLTEFVTVNGVPVSLVNKCISDLVLIASSQSDKVASRILKIVDDLSSGVIDSIKFELSNEFVNGVQDE